MACLLRDRAEVTICGRSLKRTKKIARAIRVMGADLDSCASKSDILIVAVPTEVLSKLAERVSKIMKEGALFVDLSSVKCGVVEEVARILPNHIEYASIHPLFASPRIKKKNVIIISIRNKNWAEKLRKLLAASGMNVIECDAETHDRTMATFQVLHHFVYLSLIRVLKKLGYDNAQNIFATHTFRRTLEVLKLIERNIRTVEEIQKKNRFAPIARMAFIEEAEKLDRILRENLEESSRHS